MNTFHSYQILFVKMLLTLMAIPVGKTPLDNLLRICITDTPPMRSKFQEPPELKQHLLWCKKKSPTQLRVRDSVSGGTNLLNDVMISEQTYFFDVFNLKRLWLMFVLLWLS